MSRPCSLSLSVTPYVLPFVRPIVTSQVRAARRHGWWLRLAAPGGGSGAPGAVGCGELAPWPGFGTDAAALAATLATLPARVDVAAADVAADAPPLQACAAVVTAVSAALGRPLPSELQWALELATLDLLGQQRGLPVAALLHEAPLTRVAVHAQVDSAVAAAMARDQGFAAYKIKVGRRTLDDEGSHVAAVRVAIGDAAALRLDANGAWPTALARRALCMLAAQAPDWVEQPVAAGDLAGMAQLRQEAIVPLAVDEGATTLAGLAEALRAGAADVVVLKPAFLGGVAATLAAAELARSHGVRLCLTHAFESRVGCLGALHLAAALRLRGACGLLPALRDAAPTPALVATAGALHLGEAPGLGLGAAGQARPELA